MRKAYKMFNKDLSCRGYRFEVGKWYEEEREGGANTAHNGFHSAYNPLDCLSYYGSFEDSRCFIVELDGDMNEDDWDSKIATTKIKLLKELDLKGFVAHAMMYVYNHPMLKENSLIKHDSFHGIPDNNFVIVRGKTPKAAVPKGVIVGLLQEDDNNKIVAMDMYISGTKEHRSNTYYTLGGVRA